jgi:ADP-ribosylglycohydrolase
MLAAAIGDALGWPIENRSGRVGGIAKVQPRLELVGWVRREGGGYAPHEVEVEAGSYSDDTQLTLAVGRSRLRGPAWWAHWTECELPLWLLYERGGGGASKRAAQAWNRGQAPWSGAGKPSDVNRYFDAGGNGVAMRIMPHVLVGGADEFAPIASDIFADGICTHGHPRALIGALAHGHALWLALGQQRTLDFGELVERSLEEEEVWATLPTPVSQVVDWESQAGISRPEYRDIWERSRGEMRALLELCRTSLRKGSLAVDQSTLEGIGAFDKKTNGAGTIAAAAAVFLASRYAAQPGQGLLAAAFAKGADTDTIAAMSGSLLGAIHDDDWLAGLRPNLQDSTYVEEMAGTLAQEGFRPRPVGPSWRQKDRRGLLLTLAERGVDAIVELPAFGACEVVEVRTPTTRSSNSIEEWTLRSDEGPTLHVKRVAAIKAGASQPPGGLGPRPPFWLVLQAVDLDASEHFYVRLIGLPSQRRKKGSDRIYVSDRIVLEACRGAPTVLPTGAAEDERVLLGVGQALTLFRSASELEELHQRLISAECPVSKVFERDGRPAFRCADPDGNVVEVRAGAELK